MGIFEIFGVRNNNENEVEDDKQEAEITTEFMIDDGLLVETTSATTTPRSTTPTSTTTSTTTASTTTATDVPLESSSQAVMMDGSKIIFSDDEISERNKDLASRVYIGPGQIPPRPASTEQTPRKHDPNSRIFFPE